MYDILIGFLLCTVLRFLVPIHGWSFDTEQERWDFAKQFMVGLIMVITAYLIGLCIWAYFQVLPMEELDRGHSLSSLLFYQWHS